MVCHSVQPPAPVLLRAVGTDLAAMLAVSPLLLLVLLLRTSVQYAAGDARQPALP
jgi:hypothetical protein